MRKNFSTKEKKLAQGFNSVLSCPNCNKPNIKDQNIEISRHEFTDEALLEELITRIKKGCIRIRKDKGNWYWFEDECRWDLSRGMKKDEKTGKIVKDENEENYTLSLQALLDFQEKYRKLEDNDKLCNICLERELMTNNKIFCQPCWNRERKAKVRSLRTKKSQND